VSTLITQLVLARSEEAPPDQRLLLAVDCRETLCRIATRADGAGQALLTKLAAFSPEIEIADDRGDGTAQLTAYVALPGLPSNF